MISAGLICLALAAAGWAGWRWGVRPLLDLRDVIRALANEEAQVPIVRTTMSTFSRVAADLGRIADRERRQRRQLAEEGFSLRAILGSMVEGVVIVDSTQRIRLANEAVHALFEFSRSPIGRTVLETFQHPEMSAAIDRSLREMRTILLEIRDQPRVGMPRVERHFRMHFSPLLPTGSSTARGVLGVFDDVTETRKLEAVRRDFVANVSHEFRTPLSIINGYVETLLDGALDDRPMAEHSLAIIQKHTQRLNFLIDDLLTISRIERENMQLEYKSASLRELLQRVQEQLDTRIRELDARVELALEIDEVEVDPQRMSQVFFNLLSNALQYSADGDVQIRIASRMRGNDVEISFADNGPGIPYKDQPHIFERFYRVHKDRSRDAGGTGLGLSIVKHIVMAHGGWVTVRSTPGAGATFKITLPARHRSS